jgi:hypothetical protein
VQRAREIAAELFADFVQFHGSDLAVFLDGSSSFFPVDDKEAGGTLISSSVWDKMREIDATVSILSGKQAGTPLRYVTRIRNDDLLGRHVRRLTVTFRKPSAGGSLTSCHRVMKTGDLFPVVASASSGLGGV